MFLEIPWLNWKYEINKYWEIRNTKTKKILKQFFTWQYLCISYYWKKKKTLKVHLLVAKTFLKKLKPFKNIIVNHKDLNKLNNNLDNLEYISQAANIQHYHKNK